MKNALAIAPLLTVSRLRSRRGDAWLDLLAVLSFALSTLMALTVAGGISMFNELRIDPPDDVVATITSWNVSTEQYSVIYDVTGMLTTYLLLAVIAGALLVFPIFSLGTSAARLGATGRSQRLASLRLVGVTGAQTTVMSLVETVVQWLIGTVTGVAAYFLTLPLWQGISFFGVAIKPSLMILSPLYIVTVLALLLFLALLSTIAGLQRVRISPLGVAHREISPALRLWRPLIFLAVAIIVFAVWRSSRQNLMDIGTIITMVITVLIVIGGITLVGPWILQVIAMPLARTRQVSRLLAMRRILDDPRAAWRNISGIALLSFIAGFVAVLPSQTSDFFFQNDILTGMEITLAFGFAVAALSTLTNQASAIFDRASQTYALTQVGFPRRVFGLTRAHQVLIPLLLATLFAGGAGVGLAGLSGGVQPSEGGLFRLGFTIAAGIGLSCSALAACEPLERHVLASRRRAND